MTAFAIAATRPKPKILNKRCHAPWLRVGVGCPLRIPLEGCERHVSFKTLADDPAATGWLMVASDMLASRC